MKAEILAELLAARLEGRPVVLATRLADGSQSLVQDALAAQNIPLALRHAAADVVGRDRSEVVELEGQAWFMQLYAPAYRLIVVGAVHIAQALLPMAQNLGFEVTVVDPRRPFNSAERFAMAVRVHDWPDKALAALSLDARTAVLALSHDPKLDDPALDQALRSPASYIGALGSRRSQAGRLERLAALGHGPDSLTRVRGPIGLALGAISAPEIALSILSEIVAVRRGAALGDRYS